jgi:hypothetical protein
VAFKQYQYDQSTNYQDVTLKAIGLANEALSKSANLRLVPGWKEGVRWTSQDVPVFIAKSVRFAASDEIFVPEGERFIVVNEECISKLPDIFHQGGGLEVSPEAYLGLIFLHELGHIYLGKTGSFSALQESSDYHLNLIENADKNTELAADQFAASQIKAKTVFETFELRMALNNIVWNMNRWRALTYFGSGDIYIPQLYWDEGFSHPNLILRMLIISQIVEPGSDSGLLSMFIEGRKRKRWNVVLNPITSVDQMVKIAKDMDFSVKIQQRSDRKRYVLTYKPTRTEIFVDELPGEEVRAIKDMATAIGLNQ